MTQASTTPPAASSSSPKGLEGITAGDSTKSRVDGVNGKLFYCGYPIEPLAEEGSFEQCVYLLWNNELPTSAQLDALVADLRRESAVPAPIWDVLRPLVAGQTQMDLLRTAVSALSAFDEEVAVTREAVDGRMEIERRIANRVQGRISTLVAGIYRLKQGQEPIAPRDDLSFAANFLYMVNGEVPGEYEERIFDAALTLHADHGFNASTFSARVTAATEADIYGAITSAIGTLAGRLHGGANMRVMRMLEEVGDVDKAESFVDDVLGQPKGRVMGFGHRVYKVEDPRATVLRRMAKELTDRTGNSKWFDMSVRIENRVKDKKGIFPNVDFYSASVYGSLGLDPEIYTPIFAVSRASGWLAHVLEQHADNRLIRPRANYVGHDERAYVALDAR